MRFKFLKNLDEETSFHRDTLYQLFLILCPFILSYLWYNLFNISSALTINSQTSFIVKGCFFK